MLTHSEVCTFVETPVSCGCQRFSVFFCSCFAARMQASELASAKAEMNNVFVVFTRVFSASLSCVCKLYMSETRSLFLKISRNLQQRRGLGIFFRFSEMFVCLCCLYVMVKTPENFSYSLNAKASENQQTALCVFCILKCQQISPHCCLRVKDKYKNPTVSFRPSGFQDIVDWSLIGKEGHGASLFIVFVFPSLACLHV